LPSRRRPGATAIAVDGTLFVSDTDTQRILRIAPDGTVSSLIEEPRLLRVDAMWIDATGRLWMPAAQTNRLALFRGGTSRVRYPVEVFTLQVGAEPPPTIIAVKGSCRTRRRRGAST
jgi:sugar lactone lactonase YvrE